jgi:hypothetical protein
MSSKTGSLLAFVVSCNLHRRHLTESQRAAIAAKVKPQLEEEGRARMRAAGAKGGEKAGRGRPANRGFADLPNPIEPEPSKPSTPEPWDSTAQSASMFNVSPRLVTDASKVLAESPEDAHRIESGELTVHAARTKLVRVDKDQVKQPVEWDRKRATAKLRNDLRNLLKSHAQKWPENHREEMINELARLTEELRRTGSLCP